MKGIILVLCLLSVCLAYRKHHARLRSRKDPNCKKGDPVQSAKFALGGYKLHGIENNLITSVSSIILISGSRRLQGIASNWNGKVFAIWRRRIQDLLN